MSRYSDPDHLEQLERDVSAALLHAAGRIRRQQKQIDQLTAQLRASIATEAELATIVRDATRTERPEPDPAGPILRPPLAHERADGAVAT